MTAWELRKEIGDRLEARVGIELRVRGWHVSPWGQQVLDNAVRHALHRTDSYIRWTPDLVAAGGEQVCFIDCKANVTSSYTNRHAIERSSVLAHLQLAAWAYLPIYYVFDELGVATPYDVLTTGMDGRTPCAGSGTRYMLISSTLDRSFNSVFGTPMPPAPRAA